MINKQPTKPRNPRVVLKLPPKIAEFIICGQKVHDQMTANAKTFPSPNPSMAVLQTEIDDLHTKETATKTHVIGAVAIRDASKLVLKTSLENERQYVESLCAADPGNALTIAQNAGMTLKVAPTRSKPPLAVKPGTVSGSVTLVAKATKGARANHWQYSLDGGKTWIDLPPTIRAKTSIANLTPGTAVTVRARVLTHLGLEDWGQDVTHLVT